MRSSYFGHYERRFLRLLARGSVCIVAIITDSRTASPVVGIMNENMTLEAGHVETEHHTLLGINHKSHLRV